VGDLVKTTLGPKGMDKILQSAYAITVLVCCEEGWDRFHLLIRWDGGGETVQQATSW